MMTNNDSLSQEKPIHAAQSIEDVYFGGRLKFRTKIVWTNVAYYIILHTAALYGAYRLVLQVANLQFKLLLFVYVWQFFMGKGVTIGIHRYWSHRAFKATTPLRIFLMLLQTSTGQNSILTWAREHRVHHRLTDVDADPHNAARGLLFSHMGWLMMKKHPENKKALRQQDVSDLLNDEVVMFQYRNYYILFILTAILPAFIPCLLWNETIANAFFVAFIAKYTWLLHLTWSVNSLAHYFGMQPYDVNIYAKNNGLVAFGTSGEGWHNYHHTFPWDYKASEFGMSFNTTTSCIHLLAELGLIYDLKEAAPKTVKNRIKRTGDSKYEPTFVLEPAKWVEQLDSEEQHVFK